MQKIVIIVGPTGIGKTSLSIELAKSLNGEIISGDSMQVYQEMSIGTAKIKESEKQGIVHHLVDCYHYDEEYNVKMFQEKAREAIDDIIKRGKTPIICGGTGLYIKSMLYDYTFQDEKKDDAFVAYLNSRSNDELYSLLKLIDPKSCEKIHPNNKQRLVRSLTMAHNGEIKSEKEAKQNHEMIYDAYIIGLTMPRDQLYERINMRVDMMMDEGLLAEIKAIVDNNPQAWQLQSFQGIGYKEWQDYFQGNKTLEEVVEAIKKNSRNFAKRQYTWFNNQMQVTWYDKSTCDNEQIIKDVKTWYK